MSKTRQAVQDKGVPVPALNFQQRLRDRLTATSGMLERSVLQERQNWRFSSRKSAVPGSGEAEACEDDCAPSVFDFFRRECRNDDGFLFPHNNLRYSLHMLAQPMFIAGNYQKRIVQAAH